jgi:hypothetical protein
MLMPGIIPVRLMWGFGWEQGERFEWVLTTLGITDVRLMWDFVGEQGERFESVLTL